MLEHLGGEAVRVRVLFLTTALSTRSVAPIYSNKWNLFQRDGAELLSSNNWVLSVPGAGNGRALCSPGVEKVPFILRFSSFKMIISER